MQDQAQTAASKTKHKSGPVEFGNCLHKIDIPQLFVELYASGYKSQIFGD